MSRDEALLAIIGHISGYPLRTRHTTWEWLIEWVGRMGRRHGGTVHDTDGRSWDWGQALCRELFGPQWMHSSAFEAFDEIPATEPVPDWVLARCREWEAGKWPGWVVRKP